MNRSRFSGILLIALFVTNCTSSNDPEQQINDLIRDNLPVGSTVTQVVAFLDSQRIEQFGFQEGEEPVFTPTATRPKPETRKYVLARLRNVKTRLLSSWDLYIIFYFDGEAKLSEHEMKRIGTGL